MFILSFWYFVSSSEAAMLERIEMMLFHITSTSIETNHKFVDLRITCHGNVSRLLGIVLKLISNNTLWLVING